MDTGATNHVCNFLHGFQKTQWLAEGEINLWLGDSSKVAAVAVGLVSLTFSGGKTLVLDDCLYVPNVRRNLISFSCLHVMNFQQYSIKIVSVKYDADEICCGMLVDNIYILEPISHLQFNSIESNHKRKESSSVNRAQLWHLRLVISI